MSIAVDDPYCAISDPELPLLSKALDPEVARREFKRRLPRLSQEGKLRLRAIRVTRHKPGRRCVIEYDVEVKRPETCTESVTLVGKMRARRSGNEGFRLQEAIWNAGFHATSLCGISVPEPVGVISNLQMWFQRKVPGMPVDALLAGPNGVSVAHRVAEAIHLLHRTGVPAYKRHTIDEEILILRDCFLQVAGVKPKCADRLQGVLIRCEHLGRALPAPRISSIHRDFYASQVIVDGSRLWLLDFDLYCQGDPGLDVGNFIGHITEQALREMGDPRALVDVERALENRFVELAGEATRPAVETYTILTLARHIFLSTKFPERQHLTEAILSLCEERLGLH